MRTKKYIFESSVHNKINMHLEHSLKTLPLFENPHSKFVGQPEHVKRQIMLSDWIKREGHFMTSCCWKNFL